MAGGNCPETPRQKMIGMMYLFYTALLALNVSAEVIEAFVKIDASVSQTTANFSSKTRALYSTIDGKAHEQPEKYADLSKTAHSIEAQTNELIYFLDELKSEIIMVSDGKETPAVQKDGDKIVKIFPDKIGKKDDLNAAAVVMGKEGNAKGLVLRQRLDDYRKHLLAQIRDKEESVYKNIELSLNTDDKFEEQKDEKRTWEEKFCIGMPLIGSIALLSKLQADVRNAEADILEYMIRDLEALDVRITDLLGLVSAPKSFIVRGGEYTSEIFLGALDTTMKPEFWITTNYPFWDSIVENGEVKYTRRAGVNYDTLPVDESGKGHYKVACGAVGNFKYGGLLHYKSNRGDKWYPFTGEYQVGDAGYTVSATKCNVLYKGLENPVEVAVSGYPKEAVSVSISGGAVIRTAQGGGYIVTVPTSFSDRDAVISVSVKTENGVRTLGTTSFRVLNVPPPTVLASGYKDGAKVDKIALKNNPFLTARLESDFFPFEGIKYTINRYTFTYNVKGVVKLEPVDGQYYNNLVNSEISQTPSGSQITFTNIFYDGPSGIRQTNGGINLIIK